MQPRRATWRACPTVRLRCDTGGGSQCLRIRESGTAVANLGQQVRGPDHSCAGQGLEGRPVWVSQQGFADAGLELFLLVAEAKQEFDQGGHDQLAGLRSSTGGAALGCLGEVVDEPARGMATAVGVRLGPMRHPQIPAPSSQPSCLGLGGEAAQERQVIPMSSWLNRPIASEKLWCSTANSWFRTVIRCPTRSWQAGPTTITAQDTPLTTRCAARSPHLLPTAWSKGRGRGWMSPPVLGGPSAFRPRRPSPQSRLHAERTRSANQ